MRTKSTDMLSPGRRSLLKGAFVAGLVGTSGLFGVLRPALLRASPLEPIDIRAAIDDAVEFSDSLMKSFGTADFEFSDHVHVIAPDVAETGATVTIGVETDLENVDRIHLYVPNNPTAMTSAFDLTDRVRPRISQRIRMGTTSDVIAVVRSNGKLYADKHEVAVTIGGCGG